jgi:hypothetical protein
MSQEKSGPGRNPKDPAENRPSGNMPGKPAPDTSSPNKPLVTPPPSAQQTSMPPGQGRSPDPFDPKKQNAPKQEDLIGAAADEEEEEEEQEE